MHTFGSVATPGEGVVSKVGAEYKAHLSIDAQQRADGKRGQMARDKEAREMSGKKDDKGELFKRVRTGRGGAGVIVRASGKSINPGMLFAASNITLHD